jgi:hypothetical protein
VHKQEERPAAAVNFVVQVGSGHARPCYQTIPRRAAVADPTPVPETFLTDERILNTSLFSRLPEAERREVLAAIRSDHASGRLREVIAEYEPLSKKGGDGAIFIARI